jgi:hypothetical protein
MSDILAFDTETHKMAEGSLAPQIVCCSMYDASLPVLAAVADPDDMLRSVVEYVVDAQETTIAHNAAFDLSVFIKNFPDLAPRIFQGLEEGKYQDTVIREKFLNLADTGDLKYLELPTGAKQRLGYSLADLVKQHFGTDLSASKQDDDAWRKNYKELEEMPSSEWPAGAIEYANMDSIWCYKIYQEQELRREDLKPYTGIDPFGEDGLLVAHRTAVSTALFLISARGMKIDHEYKAEVEKMLADELRPEKLSLLIEKGILIPEQPPQPYKNGAIDKETGEPKMTKAVPEKIEKSKAWVPYCLEVANRFGWEVPYTDPSDRHPDGQPSITKDWLEDHEGYDETLDQYLHRQRLQKLVTTEIPRMNRADGTDADVVHPMFDALKETGRTSSYASEGWPSFNGQNVDPRARPCFIPRDGFYYLSVDYNQMELGTAAQTCINLFGYSVMADKINAGVDLHAYLGAQIAAATDEGFIDLLRSNEVSAEDKDAVMGLFMDCKASPDEEVRAFYKNYRTLAKPTGLGYPGGLGPETFVAYAKATYGVIIDIDKAKELREIWRSTFPEMPEYHNWINNHAIDHENSVGKDLRYAYTSPLGMYRAGCFFCAAANGKALQTPSAEGATSAVFQVVRACYDKTARGADLLQGYVFPVNFIHDEILFEIAIDDRITERVDTIKDIMVECMELVTPDVKAGASAALMKRWYKEAEAVYDENNNLIPWEPKK